MLVQLAEPIWRSFGIRIPITEKTVQKLIDKHVSRRPFFMDVVVTFEQNFIRLSGKFSGVKVTVEIVPLVVYRGTVYIWIRKVRPINWNWLLSKLLKRYSYLELQGQLLMVDLHQIKAISGYPVGLRKTFEMKHNKLWVGM
ncbi:hypothetical protein [Ornithinibacillus californiensis]|uniref:hypothetical protein n=1 Tax=Ornithinibacillus californiensis TaxID=161536 RepID=UPI00064DD1C5|nr:hypothetical protein [Ornithinibacillus californiensis]